MEGAAPSHVVSHLNCGQELTNTAWAFASMGFKTQASLSANEVSFLPILAVAFVLDLKFDKGFGRSGMTLLL